MFLTNLFSRMDVCEKFCSRVAHVCRPAGLSDCRTGQAQQNWGKEMLGFGFLILIPILILMLMLILTHNDAHTHVQTHAQSHVYSCSYSFSYACLSWSSIISLMPNQSQNFYVWIAWAALSCIGHVVVIWSNCCDNTVHSEWKSKKLSVSGSLVAHLRVPIWANKHEKYKRKTHGLWSWY